MSHIHWFPGHIAKAQKELKSKLNLVDIVVEVLDSRLPLSSAYKDLDKLCPNKPRLVLLNKIDLADETKTKLWKKYIEEKTSNPVLKINTGNKKDIEQVIEKIIELGSPNINKMLERQMIPRPVRVMVVGLPNVGKSSIINRLISKAKTKTGAKAGVTRLQQWVRVHPKIDLLDTPGIIPTTQDNQEIAIKLAIVNSVGDKAYDSEFVAAALLKLLEKTYEKNIREYYKLENEEITIENIALKRNWIIKGGAPDIVRTSEFILSNFRDGKIGKITLDELPI